MRAEYRSRRVSQVQFRIISGRFDDLLCIDARLVTLQRAGDLPFSARIGRKRLRIIGDPGYRRAPGDHGSAVHQVRLRKVRAHLLQICQRPSQRFLRNFQAEVVERFQEDAFRHHQALAYGAVSCLPEVTALRVLQVSLTCEQRYFHIREFRSCEYAAMPLLLQMSHDQPLPVDSEHVRSAAVLKHQSAPRHAGLQQQVYLRIVSERLEVTDAFHRPGDRLFINDGGIPEFHAQTQPLPDHALQDLFLHLPHDLGGDLLFLLVIA